MAHAFIALNKEVHGRICEHGLDVMLQRNRDDTIARQELEIKDLKRKLEAQSEQTRNFKISRNHFLAENDALTRRVDYVAQVMRESADSLEKAILGGTVSESDRTHAHHNFEYLFQITAGGGEANREDEGEDEGEDEEEGEGETDSESSSEAGRE